MATSGGSVYIVFTTPGFERTRGLGDEDTDHRHEGRHASIGKEVEAEKKNKDRRQEPPKRVHAFESFG